MQFKYKRHNISQCGKFVVQKTMSLLRNTLDGALCPNVNKALCLLSALLCPVPITWTILFRFIFPALGTAKRDVFIIIL